jgi:Partial alpha/beta-hydrolase lipase region
MIIARDGYDVRSYVAVTEDGYLLNMQRIMPRGDGDHPAVMIQHGLLSSSADWLYLGEERALRNALSIEC